MNKKLTKKQEELYQSCCGHCRVCFNDGGCVLQKKLSANKQEQPYDENTGEIQCRRK